MSVTDELLANAEQYAATFDKGDLPLARQRHVRGGSGTNSSISHDHAVAGRWPEAGLTCSDAS